MMSPTIRSSSRHEPGSPAHATMRLPLLCVLALLFLFAAAADAYAGSISGRVRDREGLNRPGISVEARRLVGGEFVPEGAPVVSDALGNYLITDLPAGEYILAAVAGDPVLDITPQFSRRSVNEASADRLTLAADQNLVNIRIELFEIAVLEGRVTGAGAGGLEGILVEVWQEDVGEGWERLDFALTQGNGDYDLFVPMLFGALDTRVFIRFFDPAGVWAFQNFPDVRFFEQAQPFILEPREERDDVDAELARAGFIRGTVRDALTPEMLLGGIEVAAFHFNPVTERWELADPLLIAHDVPARVAITNVNGFYEYRGLPAGEYLIRFSDRVTFQYGTEWWQNARFIAQATPVSVVAQQITQGIDADMDLFDAFAPTTTSNIDGVWRDTPFLVDFTAIDEHIGHSSGVADTFYSIGGGPLQTFTEPFEIDIEGETVVTFFSVDNFGNRELPRSATVRLDFTPPVTSVLEPQVVYLNSAVLLFDVQDALSGAGETFVSVDGGPLLPRPTVTVFGPGEHTVEFFSTDIAGNAGAIQTFSFEIVLGEAEIIPVFGADRIATALEISRRAFPDGSSPGGVVIATAGNWPDALGGSALAGAVDGPILLVGDSLSRPLRSELVRLRNMGALTAYVLGGPAAVSTAVQSELTALFGQGRVRRLAGPSRFETSFRIAEEIVIVMRAAGQPLDGTVFVATGLNYPDALSASPIAASKVWPVVLVQVDRNGRPTEAMRNTIARTLGAERALLLGGNMVVSETIEAELDALLREGTVRLAGNTRYDTAVAVATYGVRQAGLNWDGVLIASGEAFPDGLAGATLGAARTTVMLLTTPARLHPVTAATLESNRIETFSAHVLGGPAAIFPTTRVALEHALRLPGTE